MPSARKERKISLSSVSETLENGLSGVDVERRMGLEGLMRVRSVKAQSLEREKSRLGKKLGRDHPHVVALINKIEMNRGMIRDLTVEVEHAKTEVPTVDENTWVLHGHVRDKNLKGIPNLTVALYDEKGNWIRQLGYGCTDRTGYFKLSYSRTKEDVDKPETTIAEGQTKPGPELFIHILDQNGNHLCTDIESITPELGRVDYREIILGDDLGICKPPIDTGQPTPGPKPEPTPGPRPEPPPGPVRPGTVKLEDIKGLERAGVKKLRSAGITEVKTFIETDDAKLKEILGDVDVAALKKEATSLLEQNN